MHGTIPVNNLALLVNPESDDLNVGSRIVGRFSKGFEPSCVPIALSATQLARSGFSN